MPGNQTDKSRIVARSPSTKGTEDVQTDPAHPFSRLPLAEGDTAYCLGHAERRSRAGPDVETIVAVLHRRHGAFTHVYTLSGTTHRGRSEVRLEKVIAGHDLAAAERFAAAVWPARIRILSGSGEGPHEGEVAALAAA